MNVLQASMKDLAILEIIAGFRGFFLLNSTGISSAGFRWSFLLSKKRLSVRNMSVVLTSRSQQLDTALMVCSIAIIDHQYEFLFTSHVCQTGGGDMMGVGVGGSVTVI